MIGVCHFIAWQINFIALDDVLHFTQNKFHNYPAALKSRPNKYTVQSSLCCSLFLTRRKVKHDSSCQKAYRSRWKQD